MAGLALRWVALLTTLGLCACGGKQEEPRTAGYQPTPNPNPQPSVTQPAPTATQPAPTGTGTAAPAAGGSAQPLAGPAGAIAQPILDQLAKAEAPPGARPVGNSLVGNFQAGQSLSTDLQLEGGRCYTVVATGMPPITEVNVRFVPTVPGANVVIAQDQSTGPQAVLGKHPNCYKNPTPVAVPVKMIVEVAAGQGLAAAQVYAK